MEQQPIHKYCWKCLSPVVGEGVHDAEGHLYCEASCRRENYIEIRKDNDDRLLDRYKKGFKT